MQRATAIVHGALARFPIYGALTFSSTPRGKCVPGGSDASENGVEAQGRKKSSHPNHAKHRLGLAQLHIPDPFGKGYGPVL